MTSLSLYECRNDFIFMILNILNHPRLMKIVCQNVMIIPWELNIPISWSHKPVNRWFSGIASYESQFMILKLTAMMLAG